MPQTPEGSPFSSPLEDAYATVTALESELREAYAALAAERESRALQAQLTVLDHRVKEIKEHVDELRRFAAVNVQLANETKQIVTALLQMQQQPLVLPKSGPVT